MNDTTNENDGTKAILPDASEKPFSLLVIEQYIKQADSAMDKINQIVTRLKEQYDTTVSQLDQKNKELLVITGQKDLLMALQKNIVRNELPKS